MRVNYVTPAQEDMPAVRYRMIIPGEYIGEYEISMTPVDADIHVFCKPYTQDQFILKAYYDMSRRYNYVFDVCDDVFDREGDVPAYMKAMIDGAEKVTCSTESLKSRIHEVTGRVAFVISDPYEFDEGKIKSIENPAVMWFGSEPSFDTLKNIKCDYPVEIVCKNSDRVRHNRSQLQFDNTITEWSIENMKKAFNRNNIVIIPTHKKNKNHNPKTKSPNRVIESIRQGMAVVAAPIPSYEQFSDWITLDENISLDNVKQMNPEAQKYVRENFSQEVIGEQWKNVFDLILGAEQKFSMAGSM
jgi:hypothetical protein